jgi:membrane protein implicated in regulation of membrane protease activity
MKSKKNIEIFVLLMITFCGIYCGIEIYSEIIFMLFISAALYSFIFPQFPLTASKIIAYAIVVFVPLSIIYFGAHYGCK